MEGHSADVEHAGLRRRRPRPRSGVEDLDSGHCPLQLVSFPRCHIDYRYFDELSLDCFKNKKEQKIDT